MHMIDLMTIFNGVIFTSCYEMYHRIWEKIQIITWMIDACVIFCLSKHIDPIDLEKRGKF